MSKTDTHHTTDSFHTKMQEILFHMYDVRQEIIFDVCDADKMHPNATKFLDILKDAILSIEKLEDRIIENKGSLHEQH